MEDEDEDEDEDGDEDEDAEDEDGEDVTQLDTCTVHQQQLESNPTVCMQPPRQGKCCQVHLHIWS